MIPELSPHIVTTTSPGNLGGSGEMVQEKRLLVYVAGAYSGDVSANIAKAEAASIALIRNGWHVFTPHKNTSGYEQYEGGAITIDTWYEMDLNILSRCDVMYVLDNWQESKGTQKEIAFAAKHGIPIFFEEMNPLHTFVSSDVVRKLNEEIHR